MNVNETNSLILTKLSDYLNYNERAIKSSDIKEVMKCGVDELTAYRFLLESFMGLDGNDELDEKYLKNMIKKENREIYFTNPYYSLLYNIGNKKIGKWEFKTSTYNPYELFVRDDFIIDEDKRILPQLGFFDKKFNYPAIYENNRLWMSVTPNEVNTMAKPIINAFGNVLTIGLGLGYYQYMISLKNSVSSITIVERDENVIKLFKKYILKEFECKDKIKIVNMDAYEYLNEIDDNKFDYCFIDIWHDASDGLEHYKKLKKYEEKYKKIKFDYWIYDTIKHYI